VLNFNLRFYPKRYKNSLCQKLLNKYKIQSQNKKDKGLLKLSFLVRESDEGVKRDKLLS